MHLGFSRRPQQNMKQFIVEIQSGEKLFTSFGLVVLINFSGRYTRLPKRNLLRALSSSFFFHFI